MKANTTKRDWRDLKPGDTVRFATGWYEVFDAYPISEDTVKVKITVDGHIETYNVRTNDKATCQA